MQFMISTVILKIVCRTHKVLTKLMKMFSRNLSFTSQYQKRAADKVHTSEQLLNSRFIDFHVTPVKNMVYFFDL